MGMRQSRDKLNQGAPKQTRSSKDVIVIPVLDDRDNLIRELKTRVRQLECIHAIFNKVADLNTPFDQILNDIAETVPKGFLYPDITCSCLIVGNETAGTANFESSLLKLEAGINPDEKINGKLQIGYLDPFFHNDSTLLEQEKKFLHVLADQIGMILQCQAMKDAFRESEQRYRNLIENSLVGIYQANLNCQILYANNVCLQMFGFKTPEQFLAEDFPIPYKNQEDGKIILNILKQTGRINNFELELVTKTGQPIVVLLSASLDSDIITGMMVDITQRKQIDEALITSEKRLAEVQRIDKLGWWDWDLLTDKLYWSDEVYRIFGLRPHELEPNYETFIAFVHPDDRQTVLEAVNQSLTDPGKAYLIEHRVVRSDGNERVLHERGEVTFDMDLRPIRMIGAIKDITSAKHAEKQLQKAFDEIRQLKDQLAAENIYLREEIKSNLKNIDIIGKSDSIQYVIYRIRQVARMKTTVLLTGETGTGKGIFARFLHQESDRRDKPFIQVNCAGLPSNLIENELFGREKGAFTGSAERQIGRFELADKGTIFLDEIGELPIELQAKLLKVIEEGTFERLGSPHTIKIDVRIVASTNRNLEKEIAQGRFRQDLFYRLNVFPVTIPSLSQRKEDIPQLVTHFTQKFSMDFGKKIESIPKNIMKKLEAYHWPGNVRELINVIERAVIVSNGTQLQLAEKIDADPVSPKSDSLSEVTSSLEYKGLIEVERDYILRTVQETGWRIDGPRGAAKILELNPSTLRNRMRKMGIKKPGKG